MPKPRRQKVAKNCTDLGAWRADWVAWRGVAWCRFAQLMTKARRKDGKKSRKTVLRSVVKNGAGDNYADSVAWRGVAWGRALS